MMREVTVGDKTLRLRGSPLSLLYYQQAFGISSAILSAC